MPQEKEFSFARFFKFIWHYFFVGALFVALGLGIGAASALSSVKTNYEKYTGSMTLNLANYVTVSGIGATESTVLSGQTSQIMETASSANVKSRTFAALKTEIYPRVAEEADKLRLFNANLGLKYGTNSLTVSFIYDVTAANKEGENANRAIAQRVVETYLSFAAQAVREQYPILSNDTAFSHVFAVSRAQPSYDLSESILESNKGVSLVRRTALGGIAGAGLAATLILALFMFDPRIKCTEDVLPFEKSATLRGEDEDAVIKLMARAKVVGAKRIAVLSLSKDDAYAAWTKRLLEYLKKSGVGVKVVSFSAENTDWLTYFRDEAPLVDDYELYFYNDDTEGIAPYIASNADLSAFFVNQRKVMAKTLQKNVKSISNDSYNCTIIHNADRAYVG